MNKILPYVFTNKYNYNYGLPLEYPNNIEKTGSEQYLFKVILFTLSGNKFNEKLLNNELLKSIL